MHDRDLSAFFTRMRCSVRLLDSSPYDKPIVPKDTTGAPYLISNLMAFIDVNTFLVAIAFITLLAKTRKTP